MRLAIRFFSIISVITTCGTASILWRWFHLDQKLVALTFRDFIVLDMVNNLVFKKWMTPTDLKDQEDESSVLTIQIFYAVVLPAIYLMAGWLIVRLMN